MTMTIANALQKSHTLFESYSIWRLLSAIDGNAFPLVGLVNRETIIITIARPKNV